MNEQVQISIPEHTGSQNDSTVSIGKYDQKTQVALAIPGVPSPKPS